MTTRAIAARSPRGPFLSAFRFRMIDEFTTPVRIASPAALAGHVGDEIAVSQWFDVDQRRIAQFAETTEDRQWIYLDRERATAESPYGGTIAHGLLTLSLIVPMVERTVVVDGVRVTVSYGFNRVRFPSAVPSGSRVRGRIAIGAATAMKDGSVQVTWQVTMERAGGARPVVVADWIARLYT